MKKLKKLLLLVLSICMLLPTTAVFADDDDDVRPKKVTKITCSTSKVTVGKSFELKAVKAGTTKVRCSIQGKSKNILKLSPLKFLTAIKK